jgi:prepilin-type N-terminal cleavage/methylation domain-containing protein
MLTLLPVRRRGFSMIEVLIVISVIGLISVMAFPRTSAMITQWRVARAAQAYGEELQAAFAIVGRNRKPMTIYFNSATMELQLKDRAGVIYRRRSFGKESPYLLQAGNISMYPATNTLEVYPPGLAGDSLTVTISKNGKLRRIRMLRGGLVQICSNPEAPNAVCVPA